MARINFDFSQDDELAEVIIYDREGEPYTGKDGKPSTVSVIGSESAEFKEAETKAARRASKHLGLTADQRLDMQVLDRYARAVKAWSGWEDDDDNPIPCTLENVRQLLLVDHIRNQVIRAVGQHSSFFKKVSDD